MAGVAEGGDEIGFKPRAGTLTLLYLASPMERDVLRAMLAEAATGVQILDELELPEPDDPAAIAAVLSDPYLVEPADPDFPPGAPIDDDTVLRPAPAGKEVPFVGGTLQHWRNIGPAGPIQLGTDAGPVLSPLLIGWASAVTHALAGGPRTAAEVREAVHILDLETIEARIGAMVEAEQLEVHRGRDGETRYTATEWLRLGIAPLAAAARMEHRHPPGDTAPIAALDVEAAFQLTLPLLKLPEEMSGSCSLAVDLDEGVPGSPAGVTARIEDGRVTSCEVGLEQEVDAWAAASAGEWLDTLIEPDVRLVRTGGERHLPRRLLYELHKTLFGEPVD
jgi:hypothetical protein